MSKLVIVGASGHSKVVTDVVRAEQKLRLVGYLDANRPVGSEYLGRRILGRQEDVCAVIRKHDAALVLIAIGDNATRAAVATQVHGQVQDLDAAVAVHPDAHVAAGVEIGDGTVVMAGAVLNPGVTIGDHCVINTSASVDHDCTLGDFVSVAPGATLGGNVTVGERSFVSLGASLIHGVTVGADTVVGAGAVVVGDLPSRSVAYGVPARVVEERAPGDSYL